MSRPHAAPSPSPHPPASATRGPCAAPAARTVVVADLSLRCGFPQPGRISVRLIASWHGLTGCEQPVARRERLRRHRRPWDTRCGTPPCRPASAARGKTGEVGARGGLGGHES
ncbi:protein of unknown function [Streptomyces murinus]